jgi:hypothetical protein
MKRKLKFSVPLYGLSVKIEMQFSISLMVCRLKCANESESVLYRFIPLSLFMASSIHQGEHRRLHQDSFRGVPEVSGIRKLLRQ